MLFAIQIMNIGFFTGKQTARIHPFNLIFSYANFLHILWQLYKGLTGIFIVLIKDYFYCTQKLE